MTTWTDTTHIEMMREDFERVFPMPKNCTWTGNGYAPTAHSAWIAANHCERWEAWKAAITKQANRANTAWRGLTDKEWVNIVKHDFVKYQGYDVDGAVAQAVKLVEAKLREKNDHALRLAAINTNESLMEMLEMVAETPETEGVYIISEHKMKQIRIAIRLAKEQE